MFSGGFGQQQQSSGFGAPAQQSGFGSGTFNQPAFGSSSNTGGGFGGFGSTPASTGFGGAQTGGSTFGSTAGGGFGSTGGFGSQPQQQGFGNTGFGAAATSQPSTGFGGFGQSSGTSAFGGTSGFGAKPTTGFGAPTTGFGAAPAATGFGGATTGGFGAAGGMIGGQAQAVSGTANPPFSAYTEKDPVSGQTSQYQSITAMPAYRNYSFEELRLQDYQQNRKFAGQGGGFGAPSAFGQQPAQTGFGASQPATGFGAPATTGFGGTTSGFGTGAGGFGTTGTTGFGSTTPATGAFGQQPQQQTTGFGLGATAGFGTTGATGGFGSTTSGTTGFGGATGFGATAAKPAFGGFGTTATSQPATGGFGAAGGLGGAGTQTTSLFGQTAPASGTTSLFGSTPASTTPAFGGFGTSAATTTPASTATPFGAAAGGGLFGTAAKPATGTGLFGATATSAPATSTPAFGFGTGATSGTTGGLFGSTTTPAATPFGAAPAAGTSLFGTPATATSQQHPLVHPPERPAAGGGLFGTTPAAPLGGTSTFGAGTSQPTSLFGSGGGLTSGFGASTAGTSSLFGASTNTAPQQPSLVASINQNIYGSNPLFQRESTTSTAEKPQPAVISRPEPQEKLPAFLPPMRFSPRHTQIRLRPSSSATFASSMSSLGSQDKNKKSLLLLDGINDDPNFTTDAYSSRRSVKTLNMKPRGQDSFAGDGDRSTAAGGDSNRVTFSSSLESDALSSVAKSSNNVSANAAVASTSGFSSSLATRDSRPSTSLTQTAADFGVSSSDATEDGEYWMSPSLAELQKMSRDALKQVANFKVGNQKWGSVSFSAPVDLTGINLNDICGNLVKFSRKSCTVYPDESIKPPRGQGMNVPAIITLSHCWPLDKATREPIKAPVGSTVYNQHVKRLKNRPETKFVDYEAEDGQWVFRVEHFSRYGLDDEDEEEETNSVNRPLSQDHQSTPPPATFTTHRDTPVGRQRKNIMQAYLFEDEPMSPIVPRTKRSSVWSSTSSSGSDDDAKQSARQHQHRVGRPGAESRPSFQQEMGRSTASFQVLHPRKFTRIQYDHSLLSRKGPLLADAGLMMGRSFRVGWGPQGTMAINGRIVGFSQVSESNTKPDSSASNLDKDNTSASKVMIVKLRTVADKEKREVARHLTTLRAQLQHTEISFNATEDDDNNGPVAKIGEDISFTDMLAGIQQIGNNSISAEEMYMWVLGQTLFDMQPVPEDFKLWSTGAQNEFEKRGRRERFSVWLSSILKQDTDEILSKLQSTMPPKEAAAASIFPLLASNRHVEATEAAIRAGNHRLASLISQTTRGSSSFPGVSDQLALYAKATHAQINEDYHKVLGLLRGNVESGPSSKVSVLQDLDWRKTLGLYLWFQKSADGQLKEALEQYTLAFSSANQMTAKPLPWYQQRHKRAAWDTQKFRQAYDILYELTTLMVSPSRPLYRVLQPLGFSPSPLDYRLSWHLYQLLDHSLKVGSFGTSSHGADKLCQDFMFQLESLGLWEWAVFVALHVQDAGLRKSSILALLARNVQPYEDKKLSQVSKSSERSTTTGSHSTAEQGSKDDFLVKQLKIPAEWLWEARALRAKYDGCIAQQVYALLRAGEHEQGHKLIVSTLAPMCIVQGDLSTLMQLLDSVDRTKVTDWEYGGNVYKRYLDCCSDSEGFNVVGLMTAEQRQKQHSHHHHHHFGLSSAPRRVSYANDLVRKTDVHRLKQELQALLQRLPALQSYQESNRGNGEGDDDEARVMREVCVSEMTSKVTTLLDLLEEEPNDSEMISGTSDDQRMLALQKLANDNFDHVLSAY
ncbi:hypothetical protein BGZ73_002983 [Actinomortierella ambigua]|nr:hypothetical protein BGZ73_002983 [Actinomortierella ambigua]